MTDIITKEKHFIDLIHVIRGQQVILDSDLAKLYGYEVKNLNKQVNRNIEKFPSDFRFQLTMEEAKGLKFQFGTLNKRGQHIKYAPFVFTEIGVYMLATVLKGEVATQQTIYIMRSFSEMRHYLADNQRLLNPDILKLSNMVMQNKKDILTIQKTMALRSEIDIIMNKFINEDTIKEKLFLDGQIFDASEAYIDIYRQAKKNIYIIDDYISSDTLCLLTHKQKGIHVEIFTANQGQDRITCLEVKNFNAQYPTLSLKFTNKVHDRFIILDYGTEYARFYICGASSKDAGHKICTITQLYDKDNLQVMVTKLLSCKAFRFDIKDTHFLHNVAAL